MEEKDLTVGTFVFSACYPGIIIGRDESDGMYAIMTPLREGADTAIRYRKTCKSNSSSPQKDVVVPGYEVDLSKGKGIWVRSELCRPLTQSEKDDLIQKLVEKGALTPVTKDSQSTTRPWVTSASHLSPGELVIIPGRDPSDIKVRMVVGVAGDRIYYVKPAGSDGHRVRYSSGDTRPLKTPPGEVFKLEKADGYSGGLSNFIRFATDSEELRFYSNMRSCGALVPATSEVSVEKPVPAEPSSRPWVSSKSELVPGDIVVNSYGVRMLLGINPDKNTFVVLKDLSGSNGEHYRNESKDRRPIKLPAGYSIDLKKGNAVYSDFSSTTRFATPSEVNEFYEKLKRIGVLVPISVSESSPSSQPSITYRFKVGDKVKRDPKHWKWGDQDGGEGNEGIVKELKPDSGDSLIYIVRWKHGHTNSYRDLDLQPYSSDTVNPVDDPVDDGNHVGKFHFKDGKAHLVIWYDSDDETMACVKDSGKLTRFHHQGSRRPEITDSYIESILRDCHHPKKRALKLDKHGWTWFRESTFRPAPDDAIGKFFDEYGVDIESPVSEVATKSDSPKLLITDIKVGDFLEKADFGAGPRLITGIDVSAHRVSYVINEHGNDAHRYQIGSESISIPGYHSLNLMELNGLSDHFRNFSRRSTPEEAQGLIDKMVAKGALIPDTVPDEDHQDSVDPIPYEPSGESSPAPKKVDTGYRSIHDVEVSFVSV